MESNESLLEFSALTTVTLAHNLQNLLSIMAACVDSMIARIPGPARAHQEIVELNAAIDRAFHISRELLMTVGLQGMPDPIVLDAGELILRARGMLWRLLGDDIHLTMTIGQAPLLVTATPLQLEWILLNLAANSRDAMPTGGELRIELESIDRSVGHAEKGGPAEPCVRLTLRDEGTGLPDLSTAQLFEPFFTTRPLGTGLGLTAAAVTVHALKGWMYVEPRTHVGTSVHVLIPRAGTRATPPPART